MRFLKQKIKEKDTLCVMERYLKLLYFHGLEV